MKIPLNLNSSNINYLDLKFSLTIKLNNLIQFLIKYPTKKKKIFNFAKKIMFRFNIITIMIYLLICVCV